MLSRAELLTMPQVTAQLPIACVEGWSSVQTWTGVPLMALARLVGLDGPEGAYVESWSSAARTGTCRSPAARSAPHTPC